MKLSDIVLLLVGNNRPQQWKRKMPRLWSNLLALVPYIHKEKKQKRSLKISNYVDMANVLPSDATVVLGTAYGGWTLPKDHRLSEASICYLAGAGEDISFDCELATRFKSTVRILDPTPRAVGHFREFQKAVQKGTPFPINNSETEFYEIDSDSFRRLTFLEYGLADIDGEMNFFSPKDPNHASYSSLNLQHTDIYISVPCCRLSSIMKENNDNVIDLLKMDIEGGEYMVIRDLVSTRTFPRLLLIEFDEVHSALDSEAERRIATHLRLLADAGYKCVAINGCNATFVR